MMLISEASGRKVVSIATAETVGKIDEFAVDPQTRSVVALELKKTDSGSVVRWSDLAAFGGDAVTVADAGVIGEPDEQVATLIDKHHRPMHKLVLSTKGDELGKVEDIDFDAESGALLALVVGGERLPGEQLVGIGTYAVVVRVG